VSDGQTGASSYRLHGTSGHVILVIGFSSLSLYQLNRKYLPKSTTCILQENIT